jgi:hypothetical protein
MAECPSVCLNPQICTCCNFGAARAQIIRKLLVDDGDDGNNGDDGDARDDNQEEEEKGE